MSLILLLFIAGNSEWLIIYILHRRNNFEDIRLLVIDSYQIIYMKCCNYYKEEQSQIGLMNTWMSVYKLVPYNVCCMSCCR